MCHHVLALTMHKLSLCIVKVRYNTCICIVVGIALSEQAGRRPRHTNSASRQHVDLTDPYSEMT